jgi:hypothetical protein
MPAEDPKNRTAADHAKTNDATPTLRSAPQDRSAAEPKSLPTPRGIPDKTDEKPREADPLTDAVDRIMRAMPGARLVSIQTKLPPLAPGEHFALHLTYDDGTTRKVQPTPRRNVASEVTQTTIQEWTGEGGELVAWFRNAYTSGKLPKEAFDLTAQLHVVSPATWYESIDRDISAGRQGPRAAALLEELRRLKKIVEEVSADGPARGGKQAKS